MMNDPFENLQSMDLDVPSFYEDQEHAGRNVGVILTDDRTHRRIAARRTTIDLTKVANAAKQLDRLPEPGESIHGIMRGNFDAFDFVPAMLDLIAPATLAELNIATLGFNERNAAVLIDLIDAGEITRASFIGSHFWKSHETGVFDALHHALTSRGHRCLAMRCHAKILLFETTDGRSYVMEGSANLRSCRNLEQFVLTQDADLLQFHRQWMAEMFEEAAQ
jgi:hypothetical protein